MMMIDVNGKIYYIRLFTINLNLPNFSIDEIIDLTDRVQIDNPGCVIQFFNDKYILDSNHILNAIYFMLKAFKSNRNIASSKNLELLLYLACNRQIKQSLKFFGLNNDVVKKGILNYCIIHEINDFDEISKSIDSKLNSKRIKSDFHERTVQKFNLVRKFFEITKKQLIVIQKSYGIMMSSENLKERDLMILYGCLNDLIREKMTLLSLEKVKNSNN